LLRFPFQFGSSDFLRGVTDRFRAKSQHPEPAAAEQEDASAKENRDRCQAPQRSPKANAERSLFSMRDRNFLPGHSVGFRPFLVNDYNRRLRYSGWLADCSCRNDLRRRKRKRLCRCDFAGVGLSGRWRLKLGSTLGTFHDLAESILRDPDA
jgi:hypothetical protein